MGRPKRLPENPRRLSVLLHPDLMARLYLVGGKRQLSISDVVRELLAERLDELGVSTAENQPEPKP